MKTFMTAALNTGPESFGGKKQILLDEKPEDKSPFFSGVLKKRPRWDKKTY